MEATGRCGAARPVRRTAAVADIKACRQFCSAAICLPVPLENRIAAIQPAASANIRSVRAPGPVGG